MKFQDFTRIMTEKVMNRAGNGAEVMVRAVRKNNGVRLAGMTILAEGKSLAPTVYLEDYYRSCCAGVSTDVLADRIVEYCRRNQTGGISEMKGVFRWENAGKHIRCRLINYDMNREMLEEVPFRRFLDLALICYLELGVPGEGTGTVTVSNAELQDWGISDEKLFRVAVQNTRNEGELRVEPVQKVLKNMGNQILLPDRQEENESLSDPDELPLLVITMNRPAFGAVSLIFGREWLPETAERLRGDLYVIPSSIHELLALRADGCYSKDELSGLVREVNRTQVAPEEVLADHVYCYSRIKGTLTV